MNTTSFVKRLTCDEYKITAGEIREFLKDTPNGEQVHIWVSLREDGRSVEAIKFEVGAEYVND